MDFRIILYHKQSTSARTRFVQFEGKTVLGFAPVVALSQLHENGHESAHPDNMRLHPTAILKSTEEKLGLNQDSLKPETEFQHSIEVPGGNIPVLLAEITTTDPPFQAVAEAGGSFIDLTQARQLPQVELQLLRHAYELVLGG